MAKGKMDWGYAIKSLRDSKSLTQEQLSKGIRVGSTYLCRLETNGAVPSIKLLQRVAEFFGVEETVIYRKALKLE